MDDQMKKQLQNDIASAVLELLLDKKMITKATFSRISRNKERTDKGGCLK